MLRILHPALPKPHTTAPTEGKTSAGCLDWIIALCVHPLLKENRAVHLWANRFVDVADLFWILWNYRSAAHAHGGVDVGRHT